MALLKVGSKAPVFVTHLEFVDLECRIFCQVGDVGGQADTLAERIAESVENGLASPVSQCATGDLCLALFHEDNSWYRGRVLQNLGHSLKVFFIDYGNTETVKMNDIREAPEYVLAIPALSTKCVVSDCTPLSGVWTEEEKKKIETMLHSGEFTCEIIGTDNSDVNNEVYTVKLYNNDAPNTPIFVRPAAGSSQSLKPQSLSVGQEYEAYISYVESARKFWIQLKSQENDLNSLMADIGACFAEDLPSTGDIVNPSDGQVCAACFSDDGAFYRGIVKNIQGGFCTVFFVDYGNKEDKRTSELFTLPQALCKLPVQAVPCAYHVESPAIEDKVHKLAEEDSPSLVKVLSGNCNSGYVVEISTVEQMLKTSKTPAPQSTSQTKNTFKLWESYSSVVMQVDGIYDVCLSHVDHPGQFYIQLLANAGSLDKLMKAIDEVAHNYDRLSNLYQGYPCLAKFSDDSWYRGEVVKSEAGKVTVVAVDFGFMEVLPPSQLRNTDPNLKQWPAHAVKCTIDLKKLDQGQWKAADIERFKALVEKSALVAKVSNKEGCIHQIDLYETDKGEERHLNAEFMRMPQAAASEMPAESQARAQPVASSPKLTLLQPEVSVGSKYVLCFTAVKSPYIYGQLTSTPVDKIAKLQTDLNTFFDKKQGETLLSYEIGSVCCTQYVDGGWYRGMVTSVSGGKAEVAFVDFGDSVMKSSSDLKVLPPSVCGLPQQCVLCKIDNIPPTPDKLEKLVNKRAEVLLTGKEGGVYPTFGAQITDKKLLGQFQETQSSQPAVFKGASSRTFGRPQKDEASVPRVMTGREPSEGFTQQEVVVNSTQKVMVTYVKDPSNFQVVLDTMNSSLDDVMDQLHEYYDALPPGADKVENPKLGQPCVAQFTEDQGWYRAVITGLMADGQAEVMFVDYGNNEYSDRDALKVIKPEFMSLPAQAVQCRLSGVSSSQGFWSPEHIVQFTEMVEEQSFTATFKAKIQDQGQLEYKVELVDKKGININQKFGSMTGTTCHEAESGSSSRSVTASKLGHDMKITVAGGDSEWDEEGDSGASSGFGNKPRSFGAGRQSNGASSGFGSRPTGFSAKSSNSTGGDNGWGEGSSGETSSGFGNKKTFRSGGFREEGGSGRGGFGGGSRGGARGGFRGSRPGGFGNSSDDGGGFGGGGGSSDGGGFGKSGGFGGSGGGFGAGGAGGKDCFKCGESGHISRECPNAAKGGGGRDCYKCGEPGHMARDCTNQPKAAGGGGRECYKCGESGHMARDCTNPPKGGGGGGRDCFKCGESGHMARDCTNPPKAGGGGGRECYKCGESGHMARDCSNPPKEGAGPRKGFGGSSDRSSGSGFGSRGGGFGSRDRGNEGSEDRGGFGNKDGESRGFRSNRGGFGGRSGDSGGGFGSRNVGFSKDNTEDDWGGSESSNKVAGGFGGENQGGFGGGRSGFGRQSSGFGKKDVGGGGDDWDTEVAPVSTQLTNAAGDGPGFGKIGRDSQTFTTVTLNTQETVDVYVVYVTSPDDFWCQVMKNCPNLEKLMEELNAFYNGLPEGDMALEKTEIGVPCAAKFSEDNMWYRAEVLSRSQHEAEVQFVDYGNTETVAVDKLRKLKPEFLTLKTQGIKCSLDDVIAVDKTWNKKAIEDFEDLTQDKHLVAKVINRTSDMKHVLDLENLDEKLNIAEAMCEKGHCTFRSMKRSPVKEKIVQSPYPVAEIQAGQEIDVYVSWIENPEQFWVQPISKETDLVELVEKIQELYTTGAGVELKADSLAPGQAVVAKFSEDEAWYRGYVEKMVGGKCKVRFIDYGNSDLVGTESVRLPTEDLLKKASHAVLCKLVGVRPLQAGQWTADARDIMDGLVKDETVNCKVVDTSSGHFSVELVSKGVDIKQELIQAAVLRGEKEASPRPSKLQSTASMLTYGNKIELTPGTTETVFVSHTDSVASFWCQLVRTSGELDELMASLEKHCLSGTGIQNFPMDMACAAKFSEDENWYRAKVTAAYPDSVEVLFVDYGNTEKVPKSDICELTEELVEFPTQAIECELLNSNKASNQLTAKFTELIGDQEVQATVIEVQNESAVVSLTLHSGKVVGEELGLSEPGSTPLSHTPAKTGASELVVKSKTEPQILNYPKTSMPSAPTMVFITQIINPGEFYVQLVAKEQQLNEMMTEISQYCQSEEAEKISLPSVGQACCAKFSDDDGWYRAKILKVDGSNVSVEFVDYGNWETTALDDIKSIPPQFVKAAPFVLKCSLEGIIPNDGSWSEESIKKFEELAVEKNLICETVHASEVILKCDDTDISEALVKYGVAKRREGSRATKNASAKVLAFRKPTLPVEPVDVYISHVNTPGDFYVQIVNQEEHLHELMEKLANTYESETEDLVINSVKQGQAFCAKYSEDEAWYRAEVTQVEGDDVTVLFVDYGNSEETTLTSLRALKDDYLAEPLYALKCKLNEVEPLEGEWSEESGVYFETQTFEKVLQCKFVTGDNVCLTMDGTRVIDQLVEKGYAKKVTETISPSVSPSKPKGQFMPQSVPTDSVSCFVSHIDDGGAIYVQLACEEDTLNTVVENVQTLESRKPLELKEVREGGLVCARYSEDQSWYRAVVTSVRDDTVLVRFVDYGNSGEIKQSSELRVLPESMQVTPPLAYACHLQGLKNLSTSQVEKLREITADKELTVTFNTSSPEYEVNLEDENGQDLVQVLGCAAGEEERVVEESAVAEAGAGVEATQVTAEVDAEASEETENEQKENVPDVDLDSITEKFIELNSLKLEVEQRVKVQVSHSDSPSKFWVQLESEKDKLNSLLDRMYHFYSACSDKRLSVVQICKDMIVAALCLEDESWHRARVVNCDNEETVTVQFLDHGKTEVITRDFLRKIPTEFCQLPVQAIECCLGAVQPSCEEWSEDAKEAFANLTADKVLLLDVGSLNEQGVYKIQLLDMGMSIGQLLLEKDVGAHIATPVAVSRKVKQVFSPDTSDDVIARLYMAKASETVGPYGYKMRDLGETDPIISSHNVLVTAIFSPADFWCRLVDNTYDFYQDRLQESYSENRQQLTNINKGDKCVICLDDKEYHRGSVLNKSEGGVHVKLVDIGNSVTVTESNIFELKKEFDKHPQLAFCCSFICTPVEGDTFTEEAGQVFKDTVLELSAVKELPGAGRATIVTVEKGIVLIELAIDRKDVAESLVEKGVVKFEESNNVSVLNEQDEIDDFSENFGAFKHVQLDIDKDYEVSLIDCSNMDRLIFHQVDSLSVLKEIQESIAVAVAEKDGGEGIDDLTSGPCLAKSPDNCMWTRANLRCIEQKTAGVDSEEIYKVFLVDYGSTYNLPKTSILPIPASLLDIPGTAIICHLDEIEPFDKEWDEECHDMFTQLYMSEDAKLVLYVNNYKRGIHEVILSAKKQGEKSVNHLLVELGLAAPLAFSQIELSVLADTAETSFHELSMARQDSYGDISDLGQTSYEGEPSFLADTSCLTEGDTSYTTEGDTSQFTEGDTSCFTDRETSCVTEGDTSYLAEGDTSQFTEGDTSQFTEGDTSCFTDRETSCVTEGDTSYLTEGDTSQLKEVDTAEVTESEGDTSVNTLDGTRWVCEDCSAENDVDEQMVECQNCHSTRKDSEYIAIQQLVKEELHLICENIEQLKDSVNDKSLLNEDQSGERGSTKSLTLKAISQGKDSVYEENVVKEVDSVESKNLNGSRYSTSDVDPRSTDESDLDLSYMRFDYSPTGYTTSELDTTELEGVDETTNTAEIDTTGLTDFDTTGIEGGGENLSTYEEYEVDDSIYMEERKNKDFRIEGNDREITIETCIADEAMVDDKCIAAQEFQISNNGEQKIEDKYNDDRIPLFIPISQQSAASQRIVLDQTFPSVSDTSYPSTLTSVSDFTFTSAYDTDQNDSMICEECKQDFSSSLDTTGCESEFSFYVCVQCQLDKKPKDQDRVVVKDLDEVIAEHDENVQKMIEVSEEVNGSEEMVGVDADIIVQKQTDVSNQEEITNVIGSIEDNMVEETIDKDIIVTEETGHACTKTVKHTEHEVSVQDICSDKVVEAALIIRDINENEEENLIEKLTDQDLNIWKFDRDTENNSAAINVPDDIKCEIIAVNDSAIRGDTYDFEEKNPLETGIENLGAKMIDVLVEVPELFKVRENVDDNFWETIQNNLVVDKETEKDNQLQRNQCDRDVNDEIMEEIIEPPQVETEKDDELVRKNVDSYTTSEDYGNGRDKAGRNGEEEEIGLKEHTADGSSVVDKSAVITNEDKDIIENVEETVVSKVFDIDERERSVDNLCCIINVVDTDLENGKSVEQIQEVNNEHTKVGESCIESNEYEPITTEKFKNEIGRKEAFVEIEETKLENVEVFPAVLLDGASVVESDELHTKKEKSEESTNITKIIKELMEEVCDHIAAECIREESAGCSRDSTEGPKKIDENESTAIYEAIEVKVFNVLEDKSTTCVSKQGFDTDDDVSDSAMEDEIIGEEYESPYEELDYKHFNLLECKTGHLIVHGGQNILDGTSESTAEKSEKEDGVKDDSSKDVDSDKEDFEDAPENDVSGKDNTKAVNEQITSSPDGESVGTGDSESFYDVEEEDKEEEKTD